MPSKNNNAAPGRGIIITLCLLAIAGIALGYWWFLKLDYGFTSEKIIGRVEVKSQSARDIPGETTQKAIALKITFSYESPDIRGYRRYKTELAPYLYPFINHEDELSVYYNPLRYPEALIAHPLQYWGSFGLVLCVYSFILFITIKALKNNWAIDVKKIVVVPLMLLLVGGLVVTGYLTFQVIKQSARQEIIAELEAGWPSWPEFEQAVPKPEWWSQIDYGGINPMTASKDELRRYRQSLYDYEGDYPHLVKFQHYKVMYALILRFREDPEFLSDYLTFNRNVYALPLYEFFFYHYFNAEWDGGCNYPCNDDNYFTSLAETITWLQLNIGRVEAAEAIFAKVLPLKYPEAYSRTKYVLFYQYARLKIHQHGRAQAKVILAEMYNDLLEELKADESKSLRRAENLWGLPIRQVGGPMDVL